MKTKASISNSTYIMPTTNVKNGRQQTLLKSTKVKVEMMIHCNAKLTTTLFGTMKNALQNIISLSNVMKNHVLALNSENRSRF